MRIFSASAAYLHFFRILAPYFQKRKGKGTQRVANSAGTVDAQLIPRLAYIYCGASVSSIMKHKVIVYTVVNKGKTAPKADLINVFAAKTLAA